MKRLIKMFFRWIFEDELKALLQAEIESKQAVKRIEERSKKLANILENIDVSVDVHHYSRSWAVISIQGTTDYVKFVDLGEGDLRRIAQFVSQFDRRKIDATPQETKFIKTYRG